MSRPIESVVRLLRAFGRDERGAMIIETAFVAPVLALLALGGFEVSQIVSRQHELQSGVAEAEAIVLAANMGATTDTNGLKSVLVDSLGLTTDQVTVEMVYRCNAETTLFTAKTSCAEDDVVSTYVRIRLTDTYTPIWRSFGVDKAFSFNVLRTVQLS